MQLSVIIPIYNEENRIRKSIIRLDNYLRKHFKHYEIVAVDDGSKDKTSSVLKALSRDVKALRMVYYHPNHGKGFAVRLGFLEAKGDLIVFTDADLSTPPKEITTFVEQMGSERNVLLIGSRNVAGADIKIKQPCYRFLMGRVFNLAVRAITKLPFRDTQCGFKMLSREMAKTVCPKLKEDGFVFDVELILMTKKMGYQVREVPVRWVDHAQSKIRPLQDSLRMFRDLVRVASLLKT